ncbi:unnamed protein product, partial [marine sediment metagenome]
AKGDVSPPCPGREQSDKRLAAGGGVSAGGESMVCATEYAPVWTWRGLRH